MSSIGKDKWMHLAICLAASILHPMLAVGLALGKEYGDSKASGNHWCWWDLLADAIGIAVGFIIRYYIIDIVVTY